jgi:hypothetical protein
MAITMQVWAKISNSKLPDFNWFLYFFLGAQDLSPPLYLARRWTQSRNISLSLSLRI